MRALRVALLLTLVVGISGARAEEEFAPSEELDALLSAVTEGGAPLLSPKEREYFDALPGRARALFSEAVEEG